MPVTEHYLLPPRKQAPRAGRLEMAGKRVTLVTNAPRTR